MPVFDKNTYLQSKADSLNNSDKINPQGGVWTKADVATGLTNKGFTPESHYEAWGKDEGINPYKAPVYTQDDWNYVIDKTNDLNAKGNSNANVAAGGFTPTIVRAGLTDRGMTPQDHFAQYGGGEGLTYGPDTTIDKVKPQKPPTLTRPVTTPTAYAAPTYNAPTPYVPDPTQMVAGQMDKLTSQNSPYMQQATRTGERSAQARGLLNSTMAGTAGQSAALASALPIATADAGTFADAGMAGYTGQLNAALANLNSESQHNLTVLQGKINSDLSYQQTVQSDYINARNTTLQGMVSSGISAQEADQALTSIEYQGLVNAGLSDRQAQDKINQIKIESDNAMVLDQAQQEGENYRRNLENNINLDKLNAAEREIINNTMSTYAANMDNSITSLQANDQLNEAQKSIVLANIKTRYENNISNLFAMYPVELSWLDASDDPDVVDDSSDPDPDPDPDTNADPYDSETTDSYDSSSENILPTATNRAVVNADGTVTKYIGTDRKTGEVVYITTTPRQDNIDGGR